LPRRGFLAFDGTLALPACSFPERGVPVPRGQTSRASVLGFANERFFPALGNAAMEQEYA